MAQTSRFGTVAILAQGTSWAVAVTQAFLSQVRFLPPASSPHHPRVRTLNRSYARCQMRRHAQANQNKTTRPPTPLPIHSPHPRTSSGNPITLYLSPFSPYLLPCTPYPSPFTLYPQPFTLYLVPFTLYPLHFRKPQNSSLIPSRSIDHRSARQFGRVV